MILHVDANTFYASCERLFRPDLDGQPIAVLTNNDGVIIALNKECKALGFKRGDIYFQKKAECSAKGVRIFSSNYTLYADLSARINSIYSQFCPDVEIYSIDESFLNFPDWINVDFYQLAKDLRDAVIEQTHIPVSVGCAPTKTLAKMCNKLAKTRNGICIWDSLDKKAELEKYAAADIWGIGPSKAKTLYNMGIRNALQLSQMPLDKAKQELTITGFRTVKELNEIPFSDISQREFRDNISTSKSFARGVTSLAELETALCEYAQLAVERMIQQKSSCRIIEVFLGTARDFCGSNKDKEYFNFAGASFEEPQNYLPVIVRLGITLLHRIYRQGFAYRKVAISLFGLENDAVIQPSLFPVENEELKEKKQAIMNTFTEINNKYGRGCLHLGVRNQTSDTTNDADKKKAAWIMSRDYLSPEYTTQLSEIPVVTSGID